MGADAGAIFICLQDVVCRDRYQPAVADFELAVQLREPIGLSSVLGPSTAVPKCGPVSLSKLDYRTTHKTAENPQATMSLKMLTLGPGD